MDNNSLSVLLEQALKEFTFVENKIIAELPLMIDLVQDDNLKTLLSEHLKETEGQADMLTQTFKSMEVSEGEMECSSFLELLEEGKNLIDQHPDMSDILIANAALKVEHYEMGMYGGILYIADNSNSETAEIIAKNIKEIYKQEESAAQKLEACIVQITKDTMQ